MMVATPVAIVRSVYALGGSLSLGADDRLKVKVPAPCPSELLEQLRTCKPEILTLLRHRPKCCECGGLIVEPEVACWGGRPVHLDCGERAWRREWQAKAPGRDVMVK